MYTVETKPGLTDRMIDDIMPPRVITAADALDIMAKGMRESQRREERARSNPMIALMRAWIELFMWPFKALP